MVICRFAPASVVSSHPASWFAVAVTLIVFMGLVSGCERSVSNMRVSVMSKDDVDMRAKPRASVEDYEAKLAARRQDWYGAEHPDDTPMAPPIGYKKQPSMVEIVREAVRSEHLRLEALRAEQETFEEADDFDVPDDPVPPTGYEMFEPQFEPPVDGPAGPRPDGPAPAAPASPGAAAPASPAPAAAAPGAAPAAS